MTGFSSLANAIRQEQMQGTLESVLLTPIDLPSCHRGKFRMGFSASDTLFFSLPLLWLVLFQRSLRGKFSAGAAVFVFNDARAGIHRHPLRKFRDGLQARRSIQHLDRNRVGALLRRLLSSPTPV